MIEKIKKRSPVKVVKKAWGSETWIVNNEEYCGKILKFNSGKEFSLHFHVEKKETFFVLSGKINLKYFNLSNANEINLTLSEGDIVDIPRFNPHKIKCIEDATIIEFSTKHNDYDSYRIEKGDSQK